MPPLAPPHLTPPVPQQRPIFFIIYKCSFNQCMAVLQKSLNNSPRGIPFSEALSGRGSPSPTADWMNGSECVWGWKHVLLPCYDVLSNNLRTKASILKWSYDGTGFLRSSCYCVSHCFLSSLLARCLFCQWDKALLWVAACSTATSVLLECQNWQSVGGIVGVIDR